MLKWATRPLLKPKNVAGSLIAKRWGARPSWAFWRASCPTFHCTNSVFGSEAGRLGEHGFAVETFAPIQLAGPDSDVTTQSRKLLALLLVEADQGAQKVARIAKRAFSNAFLRVFFQRFWERDVQRRGRNGRALAPDRLTR